MNHCKDCVYWQRHAYNGLPYFRGVGECTAIIYEDRDDYPREGETCSDEGISNDRYINASCGEESGEVMTGPEFGCVAFEAKGVREIT